MTRTRLGAGWLSALVLGATLFPVTENFREKPADGFPLSYYPMFSYTVASVQRLNYILGTDEAGTRHVLHYGYAGTGGMNQVRRQIRRRVKHGSAPQLCEEIAARISNSSEEAAVVTVSIATGDFRLDAYLEGRTSPQRERILASCPVLRGDS